MSATDPYDRADAPLNPYAAPKADLDPRWIVVEEDLAQCETIRRDHLGRETWIKLLGSLHYVGAAFGFIAVCSLIALALGNVLQIDPRITAVVVAIYGAVTALNAALGYGLRGLQPWARWTEAVLYGIGAALGCVVVLASVLIGNTSAALLYSGSMLFQGAVLYLLLSPKATVVFSTHYKDVIGRTPHVRYQPGAGFKVAVVILVTLLATTIMLALTLPRSD